MGSQHCIVFSFTFSLALVSKSGQYLHNWYTEDTLCVCLCVCRDAIESAGHLYNQVDELVHKLVMLSNKCTQELEFIMEFKILEEGFREVSFLLAVMNYI